MTKQMALGRRNLFEFMVREISLCGSLTSFAWTEHHGDRECGRDCSSRLCRKVVESLRQEVGAIITSVIIYNI